MKSKPKKSWHKYSKDEFNLVCISRAIIIGNVGNVIENKSASALCDICSENQRTYRFCPFMIRGVFYRTLNWCKRCEDVLKNSELFAEEKSKLMLKSL